MINPANPVGAFLQGNQLAQQQVGQQQDRQMRQQQFGMQQTQFNQGQQDRERQQQMELLADIGQAADWILADPNEAPARLEQARQIYRPIFGDAVNNITLEQLPMLRAQVQQELQGAMPAGLRELHGLADAGQFTPEELQQAARVQAGIQARPSSAAARLVKMEGSDGRNRFFILHPDSTMTVPTPQQLQQMGGEGAAQTINGSGVDIATSRRPEDEPPAGFEWRTGENGERRLVPQAGSQEERQRDQSRNARTQMLMGRVEPFVRDAQRALALVDSAGPIAGAWAVPGEGAGFLRRAGAATLTPETFELNQHLESLKSNISIEQLQQMREASPTGGALGQIPVRQQEFLMQLEGSLDPRLEPDVLRENIATVSNNRIQALANAMYGDDSELRQAVQDGRITDQQAREAAAERDEFIRSNQMDQNFRLQRPGQQGQPERTATNPQTGERLVLRNGQWVPADG